MLSRVVDIFVQGTPYGYTLTSARKQLVQQWKQTVIGATLNCRQVSVPCRLQLHYILPDDKFALHPCGPDLDNLTKTTLDALKGTVFSPPGDDSFVTMMELSKERFNQALHPNGVGVHVTIYEL